jgi:phosphoglycerate kinase
VTLAADVTGPSARAAVASLEPGGVVMLENLRFDARETSKDDTQRGLFAGELAALADLYVSDGFGVVHRRQASVYDVARRLPHAAGYLVRAEVAALRRLTAHIRRPYVVVLGGAKVEDKFGAIGDLIGVADRILIGGAMAFPFLAAEGYKVGTSLLAPDQVDLARATLDLAGRAGTTIILPSDAIAADGRTRAVASALATGKAFTVIGGGDTGAAIRAPGFPDSAFGYISTGGGASLEFIQGKTLPGLAVLDEP